MYDIILDLPNVLIILLFVILCYILKLIPSWLAFIISFFSFTPFFINDLLFPASFMPDQYRYFNFVQQLRSLNLNYEESNTVLWSSWIFALMPLPFLETIKSLGFFNRFAISALIVWLYACKGIRGLPLLFLILYPSLLLYSSLALRDTIIFVLMIVAIFAYIDGRRLYSLFISCFLIFIKFQNFFLTLIFMILHDINKKNTFIHKYKYFFILVIIALWFYYNDLIIESLNFYRFAMYAEDGVDVDVIFKINNVKDLIVVGLPSAWNFLVNPLPWNASNLFQLIQSIENLLILLLLAYALIFCHIKNFFFGFKWILFLSASFLVYGLVVSNSGTAVRYKFPFVLIVVVGIFYEINLKTNKILVAKNL